VAICRLHKVIATSSARKSPTNLQLIAAIKSAGEVSGFASSRRVHVPGSALPDAERSATNPDGPGA
jgi:hypothetical protein